VLEDVREILPKTEENAKIENGRALLGSTRALLGSAGALLGSTITNKSFNKKSSNKNNAAKTPLAVSTEPEKSVEGGVLFSLTPVETVTPELVIENVWNFYLSETGRNPKSNTFTNTKRKHGMARLRDALRLTGGDLVKAQELLEIAIEQIHASKWHRENQRNTWEVVFRSTDEFEKWVNRSV
jgi:hypothetical protein